MFLKRIFPNAPKDIVNLIVLQYLNECDRFILNMLTNVSNENASLAHVLITGEAEILEWLSHRIALHLTKHTQADVVDKLLKMNDWDKLDFLEDKCDFNFLSDPVRWVVDESPSRAMFARRYWPEEERYETPSNSL